MRRLAWGLLATFGLTTLVACGPDDDPSTATAEPLTLEERAVDDTALASASRGTAPSTPAADPAPRPAEFTILVTSPEGLASPGLDATVSALLSRPDLGLTVVAPAADATSSTDERSPNAVAPVPAETMTGHPASAVNGTMADTLDIALTDAGTVDLVVVGATADPDAVAVAEAVRAAGLPTLVVSVGPDPDLAAAGLLLLDMLDFQFDELVGPSAVHLLDVEACVGGIDGPTMVTGDVATSDVCGAQAIP